MTIHYQLLVSPQTLDRTSVVDLEDGENWLQLVAVSPDSGTNLEEEEGRRKPDIREEEDARTGCTMVRPTIVRFSDDGQQNRPFAATDECFLCFQYHRGLLWVKDMRHSLQSSSSTKASASSAPSHDCRTTWTASLLTCPANRCGGGGGGGGTNENPADPATPAAFSASEMPFRPRQAAWLRHGDRIRLAASSSPDGISSRLDVLVAPPQTVWLEFHCSDAAARAEATDALRVVHHLEARVGTPWNDKPEPRTDFAAVQHTHSASAAPANLAAAVEIGCSLRDSTAETHNAAIPPSVPLPQSLVAPSTTDGGEFQRSNSLSQTQEDEQAPQCQAAEKFPSGSSRETATMSPNNVKDTIPTTVAPKHDTMDEDLDVEDLPADDEEDDDEEENNDPSCSLAPDCAQSQSTLRHFGASNDCCPPHPFAFSGEWLTQPTSEVVVSETGEVDFRYGVANQEEGGDRLSSPTIPQSPIPSQPDDAALSQKTYEKVFDTPDKDGIRTAPAGAGVFKVGEAGMTEPESCSSQAADLIVDLLPPNSPSEKNQPSEPQRREPELEHSLNESNHASNQATLESSNIDTQENIPTTLEDEVSDLESTFHSPGSQRLTCSEEGAGGLFFAVEEQVNSQLDSIDVEKQAREDGSQLPPSRVEKAGGMPEAERPARAAQAMKYSGEQAADDSNSPKSTLIHPANTSLRLEQTDKTRERNVDDSPNEAVETIADSSFCVEQIDKTPEPSVDDTPNEVDETIEECSEPPMWHGRPPKGATASKTALPFSRFKADQVSAPVREGSARRSSRKRQSGAALSLSDQPGQAPARKKRRTSACRNLDADMDAETESALSENAATCYVLVTSLKESMSKKVAKMVPALGGVLLKDLREAHKCTHLIAGDGTESLKRTPKLMIALNKTTNIVALPWLLDSHAAGQLLPCRPYLILKDRKAEKAYGFVLAQTLERVNNHLRNGTSVLGGRRVHVCQSVFSSQRCPPADELKLIVEAAGGQWVTRPMELAIVRRSGSSDGCSLPPLVVTHPEDASSSKRKQVGDADVVAALHHGAVSKSLQWLLRIMMTQKYDD